MAEHWFADETKSSGLVFVVVRVAASDVGASRTQMSRNLGKRADPMLWVADGIAWAYQRGGRWRQTVEHLIVETINL